MGVLRAIRRDVSRGRARGRGPAGRRVRRAGAAAVLVALGVAGATACDPAGLNSASVAYTTDQTVTKELERQKASVRWLTCQASYGTRATPTATENAVATVDCTGQTTDGKDIEVDGRITRVVNGRCVRGELTAKVGGKEWFRVNGLGDCDATPEPNVPGGNGGGATATVTVTQTVWCDRYPDCRPVQGK